MGSSQSLQRDMSYLKNNDRLGLYRLFQEKERSLVELQRQVTSEEVYKHWVADMENAKLKQQSSMIYLPVRYHYKHTGLCGSGGTLNTIFDKWQIFLKEEVGSRRKNQHFYSEQEVWFILYNLSKLGAIYQPLNVKLGDLHPSNIIVTGEGFLKVVTRHSLPNQNDNFQKVVEEINSDVYLSPQQMDEGMIESGVYEVKNPTKADSFSLGITMLQVATLQNCSYLYIRNPFRLSLQKFKAYKNIVKGKYSNLLYNTLMSTLQLDPRYRKSMFDIYEALRPFAANIEELKPFKINENADKSMSVNYQKSFAGNTFQHQNGGFKSNALTLTSQQNLQSQENKIIRGKMV